MNKDKEKLVPKQMLMFGIYNSISIINLRVVLGQVSTIVASTNSYEALLQVPMCLKRGRPQPHDDPNLKQLHYIPLCTLG